MMERFRVNKSYHAIDLPTVAGDYRLVTQFSLQTHITCSP